VAGRVEEHDLLLLAVDRRRNAERAGALRDAAGLARGDVGVADLVQEAGLAMVDVARGW
jgi:hypothetical protein